MSELASPPSGAATPPRPFARPPAPASNGAVPEQKRNDHSVPSGTATGTLLSGRYQLQTRVGSDTAAGAEFWRALDTVLQREVAVTVLRKLGPEAGAIGGEDDPTGPARAGEMVVRALRSGSFEHTGCSRLLDVLAPGTTGVPADVLGAAVTEWVPGRSLAETVSDGLIKPLAAARALIPLAAAAEEAHRHGLVLGCDHPQRVRVTPDGRAQLCFALPRPDVEPADDVRGLGAVLYTLLTSQWPLSAADAARAGLAAAERTATGEPTLPSRHRPGVPVELDTLATGTLGTTESAGHVHTAAAVHRLLTEVVEEDDKVALFPPAHDGVPPAPDDVWQDRSRAVPRADPERKRKMMIALVSLGSAVLIALGFVAIQLGAAFSDGGGPHIVVGSPPVAPSDAPPEAGPARDGQVAVAAVDVYDTVGDRDNAGRIGRVVDGDPATGWRTFVYNQQFPALKPGVGIMMSFASAVQLAELSIESPTPGTVVEIRSATAADTEFADTVPITTATLRRGVTTISLAGSQPVNHVLVWIKKLGDGNVSEINEVQFRRAGV